MHLYLAPFSWRGLPGDPDAVGWNAPVEGARSIIDLRTLPQKSQRGGTPQGFGIFGYETAQAIARAVSLGDIDSTLRNADKNAIEGALKVSLVGTTPAQIVREMFTTKSDPRGLTAPKPLRLNSKREARWRCGGEEWFRDTHTDERHNLTLAVFRADYRRNVVEGVSDVSLRRWAGATQLKLYGRLDDKDFEELVDPEFRYKGYERPTTTVSDNFNSGSFGDNWIAIDGTFSFSSGELAYTDDTAANFPASAYYNSNLSSDDQTVEITCTFAANSFALMGAAARISGTDETDENCYYGYGREQSALSSISKIINSTNTNLATGTDGTAPSITARIEVDGSGLELFLDDVSVETTTDTDITGTLTAGIVCHNAQGERGDDWSAEDIVASGISIPIAAYHYNHHLGSMAS